MEKFEEYTSKELYFHLKDKFLIPQEDTFEEWKYLREQMIQMCYGKC